MTFALGMGGGSTNTDATDTHGALFKAFGADADRREGQDPAQVRCDAAVLEFAQKLVKFYPGRRGEL